MVLLVRGIDQSAPIIIPFESLICLLGPPGLLVSYKFLLPTHSRLYVRRRLGFGHRHHLWGWILRIGWLWAWGPYADLNFSFLLLVNEIFVLHDLFQGKEPLLLGIVIVTKKPVDALSGFDFEYMDPAIRRFVRLLHLNGSILLPATCLPSSIDWAAIGLIVAHLGDRILIVFTAHCYDSAKLNHVIWLTCAASVLKVHDGALVIEVEDKEALHKLRQVYKALLLLLLHECSFEMSWYLLWETNKS